VFEPDAIWRGYSLDRLLILNNQHLEQSSTSSWSITTATGHIERWPHAARPTRPPVAPATEWGEARVSVAIVSVVWFTSTSGGVIRFGEPYSTGDSDAMRRDGAGARAIAQGQRVVQDALDVDDEPARDNRSRVDSAQQMRETRLVGGVGKLAIRRPAITHEHTGEI